MSNRRKITPTFWIFWFAFLLRAAWVLTLDNVLVWPDEQEFAAIAGHLAAGDGYVSNSYRSNPVVPVYLAFFLKFVGPDWLIPRIGQAAIGAATCALLARLTTRLANPTAGVIAGLVLAVYPAHIYMSGVFYVACIATYLSVLGIWLVVQLPDSQRRMKLAVAAGLVLGLCALTRATFLAYLPLAPLAVLWAAKRRWTKLLPASTVMFAVSLAVVVPWALRNSVMYGQPMLISSGLWETLWKGNNELANGGADDRNMVWGNYVWNERLAELAPGERAVIVERYDRITADVEEAYGRNGDVYLARDEVLRPVVIELITKDPARFASLFGAKVITLFEAFSKTEKTNASTSSGKQLVAAVSFYPVLLLALAGMILVAGQHRRFMAIHLYLASFVFVYAMLTACTRFRLPIDPFLIVFAAIACDRITVRVFGLQTRSARMLGRVGART